MTTLPPNLRNTITAIRGEWAVVYQAALAGQAVSSPAMLAFAEHLAVASQELSSVSGSELEEGYRLTWYQLLWTILKNQGVEAVTRLIDESYELLQHGERFDRIVVRYSTLFGIEPKPDHVIGKSSV